MTVDRNDQRPRAEAEAEPGEGRRSFLVRVTIAVTGVAAALLAVPFVAFLISPVQRAGGGVWRGIGRLEEFPLGDTVRVTYLNQDVLPWAGPAAESAAWVRRVGPAEFIAFSVYCTHVGCPVRWEAGAELFMCPCHGGAFYEDGTVAAGPPPAALPRLPIRVRQGQVELLAGPIPLPR